MYSTFSLVGLRKYACCIKANVAITISEHYMIDIIEINAAIATTSTTGTTS